MRFSYTASVTRWKLMARESSASACAAADSSRRAARLHQDVAALGRGQAAVRNGVQVARVEGRVREADERLVAAAVVPGQQRGRQVARALVQEAVGIEHDGDAVAAFAFSSLFTLVILNRDGVVLRIAARREEAGRRQLHLVAHHDDLRRTVQRGHGFFHRDLAGLVEDDHVEQVGRQRQRVGHRQRAHEPDGLHVAHHRPVSPLASSRMAL
jgi:hypothetical protein